MSNPSSIMMKKGLNDRPWWGLAVLYAIAILFLWISWNRTADIVVDFGRELYVPWQMNEGQGLYRDLEYFNGPFSPVVNSVLFRVFGPGKTVLVVANFGCLLGVLTLLYREFGRYQPVTVSVLQGISVIVFAGFNHTSAMGNFNFITPYSHETTHGMLLSVLMFCLLQRERLDSLPLQFIVGVLFGWILATKAEFGIACSGMLGVCFLLKLLNRAEQRWNALGLTLISWLSGCVSGVFSLLAYLRWTAGPFDAWQMMGSFKWILGSPVTQLAFYKKIAGTDYLGYNLFWSAAALVGLGLMIWGIRWIIHSKPSSPIPGLICFFFALVVGWPIVPMLIDGRMLTLLGIVILLGLVLELCDASLEQDRRNRVYQLLVWFVFAELMLAKMAFNPMLDFYGFVLATPMAAGFVCWILAEVPHKYLLSMKEKEPQLSGIVSVILVGMIALDLFVFASQSIRNLRAKSDVVNTTKERFYCDSNRGEDFMATLRFLDERMEKSETVLVLPEGVTLNYLLQRGSGIRYYNFMPPELVMFGVDNIVASFENALPDVVVLWDRPVRGYQVPPFGSEEYGKEIFDWVQNRYVRIHQIGGGFGAKDGFGIDIYRLRNTEPASKSKD